MRIGELATATGVDVETVRYYEKKGVLPSPARRANGYRSYGPKHLERLSFIRHCRSLDMTLADIRRLLELLDRPASECGDVDELVDLQLKRVQARIASLQALERQLGGLRARCKSRRTAAKCGILAELVHAANGEACACHGSEPVVTIARASTTVSTASINVRSSGLPQDKRRPPIVERQAREPAEWRSD